MQSITPFDLTRLLQMTPEQVATLLESGEISYFMAAGEVRVLESEVQRFIYERSSQATATTVAQVLMGNQVWRNLMANDPGLLATVKALDDAPGSFGDILKQSAD